MEWYLLNLHMNFMQVNFMNGIIPQHVLYLIAG